MKKLIAFVVITVVSVTMCLAQDATPRANVRQGAQRARIHEGRTDGDLTRGEAKALNREQRHIRRTERRAKADGTVTTTEKRKIERKQDRANRHIRRTKNNGIEK